ncbi:MAG: ATP-binding protein [Methylococcaceae bacterium]|nr:MAG: ATP-binding protein [Methylococcaceae bacterium]
MKERKRNLSLISRKHLQATYFVAPPLMDIRKAKPRSKLLAFIKRLRIAIITKGGHVCIDFSNTEKLVASGTLLFVAELRRSISLAKHKTRVSCIPPKKRLIAQVFQQVGVFRLVGYRKKINIGQHDDVVHWCFATGHGAEGEKFDDILGNYDGRIATALSRKLYQGITEAMTNAHHHAYISPRQDGLLVDRQVRDWWMFSQEKDDYLHVVFCDLGVGIPETLPRKHPSIWQKLLETLVASNVDDARVIQEATKLEKSRTEQHHRGRGLGQMVKAVTENFHGSIDIYSNQGRYTVSAGRQDKLRNYESSILGTLISWTIPISKREHIYYAQN